MAINTGDCEFVRSSKTRQGLRSPINRRNNFPHSIAVAVTAITTGRIFPDLPHSARLVLAFVVRLAECKNPTKASWAFKKTIANETMLSESSIYRSLNVLTDMGFIIRFKQERKSYNGKLAVAKISLTRKTCIDLGFFNEEEIQIKESLTKPQTIDSSESPSVKLRDCHSSTLLLADQQTQSLQKHSQIQLISKGKCLTKPVYKIPREIFWLYQEKFLTPPQIFLLMREFSARKQLFSEVIDAVQCRIRKLPKNDVFRYLRFLSKSPTDFSWIVKQKYLAIKEKNKTEVLISFIQQLKDSFTGKYLRSNNAIYFFEGNSARSWWLDNEKLRMGSCPINERFAKDYKNGFIHLLDEKKAIEQINLWSLHHINTRVITKKSNKKKANEINPWRIKTKFRNISDGELNLAP